jgi:hypothetical protein
MLKPDKISHNIPLNQSLISNFLQLCEDGVQRNLEEKTF